MLLAALQADIRASGIHSTTATNNRTNTMALLVETGRTNPPTQGTQSLFQERLLPVSNLCVSPRTYQARMNEPTRGTKSLIIENEKLELSPEKIRRRSHLRPYSIPLFFSFPRGLTHSAARESGFCPRTCFVNFVSNSTPSCRP